MPGCLCSLLSPTDVFRHRRDVPVEAIDSSVNVHSAAHDICLLPAGHQSIGEAIKSATEGTIINIGPGTYQERIVLDGPSITLQASPKVSQ